MSVAEAARPARSGGLPWLLRVPFSFVIGTILATTAATSILLLGWMMGAMRRRAFRAAGLDAARPAWIMGPRGSGWLSRLLGGLASNVRRGFNAALSLAIATFPFAVFWMVAWWAGWDNSFNKGYEQAFIGPAVGFAGVFVFMGVMVYLPMALAHQAVEDRAFAFFQLRKVRSAVAHTGWGYVIWALAVAFFALPIFASRGLPVFGEGIIPGLADMSPEEVANLKGLFTLITAAYVFVFGTFLKTWSAAIYARAVMRASKGKDRALWEDSGIVDAGAPGEARTSRIGRGLRFALLMPIWFFVAALIFVGQFLNHGWHVWLSHPFVFLPWGL